MPLFLVAVALLVAASLTGCSVTDDSTEVTMPAPHVEAVPISADELARAAEVRLFFGHMSVGDDILSGLSALYTARDTAPPRVVQFPLGGPLPEVPTSGAVVHTLIGENGDPLGKLRNFDTLLRSGLAEQVDVAVLKFCYVDFTHSTDVEQLFSEYRRTLAALQRDYPRVTFLHSTAPLMVRPAGWKGNLKTILGRDENVTRERYSALVREEYGPAHVFDIAAIEGTAPDGTRQSALYTGYTTDGGHLNEGGSALVAAGLARLVAVAGKS
ncbi:MAG: SGNH/GDSL hydrolase family protein [Propionibacteriaceae bacterium]